MGQKNQTLEFLELNSVTSFKFIHSPRFIQIHHFWKLPALIRSDWLSQDRMLVRLIVWKPSQSIVSVYMRRQRNKCEDR